MSNKVDIFFNFVAFSEYLNLNMLICHHLRAFKFHIQKKKLLTNEKKTKKMNLRSATITGKSFSKAFILATTNPQYDERLFIDLPVLA